MVHLAAAALGITAAASAVYGLCRDLGCARWPARFGAAAWALSGALLVPGAGDRPFLLGASPLLFPFALTGAFSRERRGRRILALALVCAALRWTTAAPPTALLDTLVLALLSGLGAQRLWDGEGGAAFVIGAATSVALAVAFAGPNRTRLAVEVLPAAAALALAVSTSREVRARAGFAALVALFGLQRLCELGLVDARPASAALPVEARR